MGKRGRTETVGSHEERKTTLRSIPIIDISLFLTGFAEERASVATAWDETFRTVGFCLLKGYESILPEALVQRVRSEAAAFFALPASSKAKARVDGIVGYLGYGDENVAATLGTKTIGADLVESLNFAAYQEPGVEWLARDAKAGKIPFLSAPFAQTLPASLRELVSEYFVGVTHLNEALMQLTEAALDLPAGYFDKYYEKPGTLLKLAWYPAEGKLEAVESDVGEPQQRYGAHTDYDGFTILQRDPADACGEPGGGLEIQMWDTDEWVQVAAPAGTLTINIGDLMARWTNDRWRSTRHRVARGAKGAAARLSVVYFTGPHPDTLVECFPCAKCSSEAPRYAPITAGEHVAAKLRAAAEGA